MATLADIASALGLNKTTISKALNNSSDIRQETRERVLAEAARIGYTKHKRAAQNELVGVICPEVTSYYYAQIVASLNARLEEKGYGTIVTLSNFSPDTEKRQLAHLVKLHVAGVIIITEQANISHAIHATPGAGQIPIVIIGLNYESAEHDLVSIDDRRGVRAVVDHLIEQGHQKIGFVGDPLVGKRLIYFREFMQSEGLELPDPYVALSGKRNEECGYEGMKRLLALKERPTAVFAGYDTIALGAYRALSESGLRVPEDVALVGFDDSDFCSYLPRTMTSVNCDVVAECRVAIAILLSRIKGNEPQSVQCAAIIPRLVIRESSSHVQMPDA